jgi:hypothetical protein
VAEFWNPTSYLARSARGQRGSRSSSSERRLAFADTVFPADSLHGAFAQLNLLSGGLKNAMIADPDATVAALQVAVRDGSQEKIQALVLRHATITGDLPSGPARRRQ